MHDAVAERGRADASALGFVNEEMYVRLRTITTRAEIVHQVRQTVGHARVKFRDGTRMSLAPRGVRVSAQQVRPACEWEETSDGWTLHPPQCRVVKERLNRWRRFPSASTHHKAASGVEDVTFPGLALNE